MSDTVNLLKKCDAGIKMGIDAIDEVLSHVRDDEFKTTLSEYKAEYNDIREEIEEMLDDFNVEDENPSSLSKGMATLKTELKLAFNDSDSGIASVITDGCNTGVKTLNRCLNDYDKADSEARDATRRLIGLMDKQSLDMRPYL